MSDYLYSDVEERAGDDLQPEVLEAIEKFRAMPVDERASRPLLFWLLGTGTPPYKEDKDEAMYTDVASNPEHICANCIHAYLQILTNKLICDHLEGEIAYEGWCRWWED